MKLTPHFDSEEFRCHDGSLGTIDQRLPELLERIRTKAGNKPIQINSAWRSRTYNAKVGGAPDSQHCLGKAADIVIKGLTPKQVAKIAEECGATGIGTYKTFTHVDVRSKPARWNG